MSSLAFASLLLGLWTAAAVWFAIGVLWAPLKRFGASRPVLAVVVAATAAVPLAAVVATVVRGYPLIAVVLATIPLVAMGLTFRLLVRLSTASRPVEPDAPLRAAIQEIVRRYEIGDIEGFAASLRDAQRLRTPVASHYLDLWQQFSDEEARRRSGEPVSSRQTIESLNREGRRLFEGRFRPRRTVALLALGLAVVVAALPPYAAASLRPDWFVPACRDATAILDNAERAPVETHPPSEVLAELVVLDPGVSAELVNSGWMHLDVAGRSRHDPQARQKLTAAGFVVAFQRVWRTRDDREIRAEIFDFESPSGAQTFHRQMTDHGCQYANAAFAGPFNGVGLQVRHAGGDPIVEQIAWVDGSRRILVSRSFGEQPAVHDVIFDLAARAADQYGAND